MFTNAANSKRHGGGGKKKGEKPPEETEEMTGKSYRFSMERLTAIVDFLWSVIAENSREDLALGHCSEYYTTIN